MARIEYGKIACYVTPVIPACNGEVFINVTDYAVPGVYNCYKVSNFGRVYDCIKNRFLTIHKVFNDYLGVSLNTINKNIVMPIHRLMMLCFYPIPNPENYQVNHKDGVKTHNVLSNLEWATRSENILHAYRTGLHHLGEDNVHSTISNDTAIKICELLQTGLYTNQQIANMVDTTCHIVDDIKKGHSWGHISKDYTFYQRPGKLFTDDMINSICSYFENNPKSDNLTVNDYCRDALMYCGFDANDSKLVDSARKIYNHKYYTKISNNYNF